jgi:hypothetical protein
MIASYQTHSTVMKVSYINNGLRIVYAGYYFKSLCILVKTLRHISGQFEKCDIKCMTQSVMLFKFINKLKNKIKQYIITVVLTFLSFIKIKWYSIRNEALETEGLNYSKQQTKVVTSIIMETKNQV